MEFMEQAESMVLVAACYKIVVHDREHEIAAGTTGDAGLRAYWKLECFMPVIRAHGFAGSTLPNANNPRLSASTSPSCELDHSMIAERAEVSR